MEWDHETFHQALPLVPDGEISKGLWPYSRLVRCHTEEAPDQVSGVGASDDDDASL